MIISIKQLKYAMAIVLPWLLFCGYKTASLMFVKPYIALGWLAPTVLLSMLMLWFVTRFLGLNELLEVSSKQMRRLIPNIVELMDTALGSRKFRKEMAQTFNQPTVCKFYKEPTGTTLLLDYAFPSHWNSSDLMAALAWFTACMPKHIHCRYAERKENRLVFSFNLQSSTRAEHNMKLAFNICRTRLAFVLKEDLPPIQWDKQVGNELPVQYSKHQDTSPPNPGEEKRVLLEKENLTLVIGNDGTSYYSFFENSNPNTRRQYASWSDVWNVWHHFKEVSAALKSQR